MASDQAHPRITHRVSMLTDVGVIREHNEDAALVDPEGDFFIVADGMGGHAAGEVASAMAVEAVGAALTAARADIARFAAEPTEEGRKTLVGLLESAVRAAHQAVFERGSKETDKQGMGTTLDVVLLGGNEAFVAHVGDSRTYLVRDGKASQVTTDHTVAEVLVIEGKLSPEEAQVSPLRTILVNAVGVAPDVGVEMAHVRLRKGDFVLLCSDGLHDYYPLDQEIAGVVAEAPPAVALEKLVGTAKSRGGHDNITGVLFEVLDVPEGMDLGSADTGQIALPGRDAVPHEVGRDDTQPVQLGDLARGGRLEGATTDRGLSSTLPAPVDGEPPAASPASSLRPEEIPETDETMPMKQITPQKKKARARKKGDTGGDSGES
jgi:serine/threonine protein phosphatase PrpC